jgi:hypothetical protein
MDYNIGITNMITFLGNIWINAVVVWYQKSSQIKRMHGNLLLSWMATWE